MNILLTLYWHSGAPYGSYAIRQFFLVHYSVHEASHGVYELSDSGQRAQY